MNGRVLIIAGSDPSGGAGIQADIKTVTALRGYASAVITALTVQNTISVSASQAVDPVFIRNQIDAVMNDIGADAIKIGMIPAPEPACVIADFVKEADRAGIPVILDPVLVATSGDELAGGGVAEIILKEMLPHADLVTPNSQELAVLAGVDQSTSTEAMIKAGELLREKAGARSLLLKGGHIDGAEIVDVLMSDAGIRKWSAPRIQTTSTHGTGCTLATAIAVGIAQKLTLEKAIDRAIYFVRKAIETAPGFGSGVGPLNHAHPFQKPESPPD